MIHVVNVYPPSVRRITDEIWGPSHTGRAEFEWTEVLTGERRQGVTIDATHPMPPDWRVVNEMDVIALQGMNQEEYFTWMGEWYRRRREAVADGP